MTRINSLCGVALLATVMALTSCSSSGDTSSGAGQPTMGGHLMMARGAEATSLVPSIPQDNASIWIIEEIFDTLTVPSQDGKSVEPSLATKWEQSPDQLSWTFHLRDDAKFHNGVPVTSADVKFSIEQNQKDEAPFSFIDEVITGMDTPDVHTIVFHTKAPWAPFPAVMGLFANSVVPANYGGLGPDAFAEHPIGSGPFKFDSWNKGSSLTIVKNDGYWKKDTPRLDSVEFTVVPDGNTRSTRLASGQVQINEYPANSSVSSLEKQPNVTVNSFDSSLVEYLTMNTQRKPLDDVNVRKAISQAIDKQAILKAVLYGHGQLAGSFLDPTSWAHDSSIQGATYDIDAAKKSLAQSSVPKGFSTTINVTAGDQNAASEAQLVQSDLAKIGINVQIGILDPAAILAAKLQGNFDMTFAHYTTDIIDPDENVRFAATDSGGTFANFSRFTSPELDQLATTASSTSDQGARKKIYDQIQQIVADNVPFIPLFYVPGIYSYSKNVGGFHPGATGNYFLENVWLAK